jgi:hypothetical protein
MLPCSGLCMPTERDSPELVPLRRRVSAFLIAVSQSVSQSVSPSIRSLVCLHSTYIFIYLPHCPSVQFSLVHPRSRRFPHLPTYLPTHPNVSVSLPSHPSTIHPPVLQSIHPFNHQSSLPASLVCVCPAACSCFHPPTFCPSVC